MGTINFERQKVGDMAKRKSNIGRFQLWKYLTFSRFGNNFKINILGLIGLAPIIYIIFVMFSSNFESVASLPFTSFVGVGYPLVTDSLESAFVAGQAIFLSHGVILLPIAVFIAMVLSIPAQYAARNFVWSEGFFHFKHMGKAIKLNIAQRFVIGVITAVATLFVAYMVYLVKDSIFFNGISFLNIVASGALVIFSVVAILITLYAMSISMTYKLSIVEVYADAVNLTFKVGIQNIVMLVPVLFPVILIYVTMNFITMMLPLAFMLMMFIGASWIFVTWEVFSQFVFDIVEAGRAKSKKKAKASR